MRNRFVPIQMSRSSRARFAGLNKPGLMVAVSLVLSLAAGIVQAAPNCTITSTAVTFGNYDTLDASPVPGAGTLTFRCQSGVPGSGITYVISLSTGSGTYAQRTLTSGPNILNYNLYTDSSLTTVWGNGGSGTGTVSTTITKAQALAGVANTVYGNIPAQQDVVPGSYSDTITVTVNF